MNIGSLFSNHTGICVVVIVLVLVAIIAGYIMYKKREGMYDHAGIISEQEYGLNRGNFLPSEPVRIQGMSAPDNQIYQVVSLRDGGNLESTLNNKRYGYGGEGMTDMKGEQPIHLKDTKMMQNMGYAYDQLIVQDKVKGRGAETTRDVQSAYMKAAEGFSEGFEDNAMDPVLGESM